MTQIIFKFIAIIGICLVLILFFIRYKALKNTDESIETLNSGKKSLPANILTALISGFMLGSGYGAHPYNALGFKITTCVDERVIPGTMNVGVAIPAFIAVILFHPENSVDLITLAAITLAATLGAITGSGFICKMNLSGVRLMIGLGSLILSVITLIYFLVATRSSLPTGTSITGIKLVIAIVVAMLLGNLINVGTDFTIPCVTMCLLMGMSLQASFATAVFATAFMTAFGNSRVFIMKDKIDFIPCLCQFIFGSIGVALAFFLFKNGAPIVIFTAIACITALVSALIYLKDFATSSRKRKQIEEKL